MDKGTGKPLLVDDEEVTATKSFIPKFSSGVEIMTFTFDGSVLRGKDIVVFEELYQDGKLVASHADIEDKDQTIKIKEPEIGTKALDKKTSTKEAVAEKEMVFVDQVSYKELIIGREYSVKGILMDKETGKPLLIGDKEVRSELGFKADKEEGIIELEFTFDGSALQGKEIVVFEYLYFDELEIAVHTDIEDQNQTIKVKEPEVPEEPVNSTKEVVSTGDASNIILLLAFALVSATIVTVVIKKKKK